MSFDTAVVGGGPAGLATAALLARRGQSVVVLERARELGGRARTTVVDGAHLNLGGHALYRRGVARAVLDDLGVPYSGGPPSLNGIVIRDGAVHALPVTPWAVCTSTVFDAASRLEWVRRMAQLGAARPDAWAGRTVADWLSDASPPVRDVMLGLVRTATYGNDSAHFDAGAALQQLQLALWNVLYLDRGWQTLIDGLAARATELGVEIRTQARVQAGDSFLGARHVVLAVPPAVAAELTGSAALAAAAAAARPARAACLDVVLSHLPEPDQRFSLDLDTGSYVSVHSGVADLAPGDRAVVQAMAYLSPEDEADRRPDLEALLDRIQPGWRELALHTRYLPRMTVTAAMPQADEGGLRGRFGPAIPDVPDAYVVGDWVGSDHLLFDGAMASAREVAGLVLDASNKAAA